MKKRIVFILQVLFLGLFFVITQRLYSNTTGFKYIKNYSPNDYNNQIQNWGIVQAKNGIIYVANEGGVLEFDGVCWRTINVPNDIVRSIAIDETGTIYIGGRDEIGYLAPGPKRYLEYMSLLDQFGDEYKNFSYVWSTHATKEGIYFRTSKFLFRWDFGEIKVWLTPRFFCKSSFVCNGELFFQQHSFSRQYQCGLFQVGNDSLELMAGGEAFANKKIFVLVPYDNANNGRSLLIGTRSKGFYLYDDMKAEPFFTEVDDYLKINRLYHGIRLSSGDFALATQRGGLVIMDLHGRLKYIFNKNTGLQDNNVIYVFEDIQKNLWLCLSRGIAKIEYASPISIHDKRSNLPGLVLSVVKHNNELYVGTTNGLYYLEGSLKLRLIPEIFSKCWSLSSIEGSLLAATSEGVFHVKNNVKRRVIKDSSYVLFPSKHHPGRIWCGTSHGLVALSQKKGQWIKEHQFETINQKICNIIENKKGNVWLVTQGGNVLKVKFPVNINKAFITQYGRFHGLPGGEVNLAEVAGHVIFATIKGLFRFDESEKRFIPDRTLGTEFAGGSRPVSCIVEDKNKNIWFHSEGRNYQAINVPGKSYKIYYKPFRMIPTIWVNAIYPDPDGKIIWLAGDDGLISYDTTLKENCIQDYQTLVRKVMVNGKEIFGGYKNKLDKAPKDFFHILEYKERNLHFEFAAPFFMAENDVQYQCLLERYDDNWSAWSKDTKRDYTNLEPGLYTFRVRAKNVYEHLGGQDVFRFKVLPPWYKTWWAFLIYVIGLFLLIFVVAKSQVGKRKHKKQKLEHAIKERTKENHVENQQWNRFRGSRQIIPPTETTIESKNALKQIFISYSHSDKEFVNRLTIDLKNAGMDVWIDEKEIKVGESISQKVEEGISNCDFFCLIISKHSFKSNWVEREYRTAFNAQLSSSRTPRIFPLLIQDVELPLLLKDIRVSAQ
jgi:ligand-binding sensor domain-containing protein